MNNCTQITDCVLCDDSELKSDFCMQTGYKQELKCNDGYHLVSCRLVDPVKKASFGEFLAVQGLLLLCLCTIYYYIHKQRQKNIDSESKSSLLWSNKKT